jgi:membrane-bound lytic murein transglycosylase D
LPRRSIILTVAGTLATGSVAAEAALARSTAPVVEWSALAREVTPNGETEWDIANIDSPLVDYWISRFQNDKRSDFEVFLRRKGRYEAMIRSKLRARGMPEDLLYLAMIESGFDPNIRSRASAVGIWQFIAETGRRYGLRIDRSVDERRDPVKSTDAALKYLSRLYRRFDSWYLAAAAYNTGENRVGRVMRSAFGRERGSDRDYYRIWDLLPRETRDYVPLMIAAARISKSPQTYGFGHVRPDAPRYGG